MWIKGLKFILYFNLKENFCKMICRWYLSPDKLTKGIKYPEIVDGNLRMK